MLYFESCFQHLAGKKTQLSCERDRPPQVVDGKAAIALRAQQGGDPLVAISAVLLCQPDNILRQALFVRRTLHRLAQCAAVGVERLTGPPF